MKLKRILSLALIATMLLSMTITPAFAASTTPNSTENVETETYTDHVDGSEAVEVTATVASTYSVTIPKTITMSGANKSADYTVSVSGDIADNETVKVAPDASFLMNTAKGDKAAVTATITQDKTEWKFNEFATQASGNVSAPLTAGQWSGSFNFDIALGEAVELISFTIDGTLYQAEDGMTWPEWCASSYNTDGYTDAGGHIKNSNGAYVAVTPRPMAGERYTSDLLSDL